MVSAVMSMYTGAKTVVVVVVVVKLTQLGASRPKTLLQPSFFTNPSLTQCQPLHSFGFHPVF